MDDWPQIVEGAWCSDDGHWAHVKRLENDIAHTQEDFAQRVGASALYMLENPGEAMTALQWSGKHVQISRDVPGGPLTIKEVINARDK